LPCLATITSCQYLCIHSLPGIKLLTTIPLASLGDPQSIGTFRMSGVGQGLYMSSPSEIQRICVVRENRSVSSQKLGVKARAYFPCACHCRLNFPDCLPCMHTKRADFSPTSGKGFLGALFSGSPATINREEMCK
jgi:hypothetical protein